MQAFQKNYIKKDRISYEDEYDKQVKNATKKSQKIEARSLVEFATKQSAMRFIGRSYTIVAIGLLSSAFFYPISVRIVKSFGLKSFFNIHFAIIPLMANFNALILGASQGIINYYEFLYNYEAKSKKKWKQLN